MLTDLTRQSLAGLRILFVLTVLLGVVYPLTVWVAGRALADRADGQPLTVDGEVVGSRLLGQSFEGEQWFHSRPSANDYDALASAPSNLGPTNPDLLAAIEQRRAEVAAFEKAAPDAVPADALTASGSGLDPHISLAYAMLQADRVAEANGLSTDEVRELVEESTDGPILGFLGVEGVNVLELNIAVQHAAR
ncbi:potassium-transporting ATPase subunit KdpC [Nocardioides dubius]|uniref:Potassium-transporting ATPase KdpC subunit n=1 Tax=Nocardioides dubius TaxID=317019 RepID=A0ABP4EK35_9ACTN